MSTVIKPEISRSNPYYISKHRYYELKHFCLQYPEWKRDYISLSLEGVNSKIPRVGKSTKQLSLTEKKAIVLEELSSHITLVECTALATDKELHNYILQSVTEGKSFEYLQTHGMPCCRDTFYNRYRKFFWLLNSVRR